MKRERINDTESQRKMLNYREFMVGRQCQKWVSRRCRIRYSKGIVQRTEVKYLKGKGKGDKSEM